MDRTMRLSLALVSTGLLGVSAPYEFTPQEIPVSEVEATAFALGIHEDTGSLTYLSATQRDAEALGW